MKIVTVVGARPQFIKAAMVSAEIARQNDRSAFDDVIDEIIVHTGQHYDHNMSRVFFEQMMIPQPNYNLAIGSGNHGATTGRMLAGIEEVLIEHRPTMILVYGDTNSTVAGAMAAAKMHIPVVHVEAGLRSFNKQMPEELNRIITDHISDLLLCPTRAAVNQLVIEGITKGVHQVGDVMYDAALAFGDLAERESTVLEDLRISKGSYYLATVHRAENTDTEDRLRSVFSAFAQMASEECPVIVPLHPRTEKRLNEYGAKELIASNPSVRTIRPVSFLDMVLLEKNSRIILTDSGGVQKEAYFHGVPCITLRSETEWVETVDAGWNQVVGHASKSIVDALGRAEPGGNIPDYGEGDSASSVVGHMRQLGREVGASSH